MTTRTLEQYVEEVFPHHRISGGGSFGLSDEAIVAHFADIAAAHDARREVMMAYEGVDLAMVEVCVSGPSIRRSDDEDPDSVIDLPARRVGTGALGVGLALGVVVFVVMLVVSVFWVALISAVFSAMLGAWVGFLLGGGGRHAGQRAWEQPADMSGHTMAVVAVHPRTRQESVEITSVLDDHRPDTVRIVGESGWRTPSSFAPEPTGDAGRRADERPHQE